MSRRSRPWRLAPLHRRLTRKQWVARDRHRWIRGFDAMYHGAQHRPVIGANHRQPRRETPAARPPAIVLPRTEPRQRPSQRPAARPSWAIMVNKRRRGGGYR